MVLCGYYSATFLIHVLSLFEKFLERERDEEMTLSRVEFGLELYPMQPAIRQCDRYVHCLISQIE